MFTRKEILEGWIKSTTRIRAGTNGSGCTTPDMCGAAVAAVTTKTQPFKHAFLMLGVSRTELAGNPAKVVLKLIKQGGAV